MVVGLFHLGLDEYETLAKLSAPKFAQIGLEIFTFTLKIRDIVNNVVDKLFAIRRDTRPRMQVRILHLEKTLALVDCISMSTLYVRLLIYLCIAMCHPLRSAR